MISYEEARVVEAAVKLVRRIKKINLSEIDDTIFVDRLIDLKHEVEVLNKLEKVETNYYLRSANVIPKE